MEVIKQNLGIDVDSKEFKVCFKHKLENGNFKTKGSRKFKNTLQGILELSKWITKRQQAKLEVHITLETTGVYHENLVYYLTDKTDHKVHVVMGEVSFFYFKSLKKRSKTDKVDAEGLAELGLERNLKQWIPGSDSMRNIKKVSRERSRLIKERTMVLNQLHAEESGFKPTKSSIKRYNSRIKKIDNQIMEIEEDLKTYVSLDKDLESRISNVMTIKGVGFIVAVSVVAELNAFKLIRNRSQLVSYCGYDVVKKESGTSIHGKTKISKKGNSYVRNLLYMAALSACRFDKHHKKYHSRIVEKTSIKLKGNVAIQRKLLLLIFALFTKNEAYDPTYADNMRQRINAYKTGSHLVKVSA
jgi:transposase